MEEIGLYIHIPFCKSKCYYCDFSSFSGKEDIIESYVKNLIKELKLYKNLIENYSIKTIFIGGGTPSYIDGRYIKKILDFINFNFNVKGLEEVTIEVNPGTLSLKKANFYKDAGINRVSIGVQSLNDDHLKTIGRMHTEDEFYESYDILRKVGFKNINLDFIFGLPGERLKDIEKNLNKIKKLKPSHISYYGLILEEGTIMHQLHRDGKINIPTDIEERQMYYLIKRKLKDMGYHHYEISNFALDNRECKHNLLYWNINSYIGIGLSSHSYFNKRRYWNRENFQDYFLDLEKNKLPIEDGEDISREIEISEFAIMNLRLIEGIDKKAFKKRFKVEIGYYFREEINKHVEKGLLREDENFIKFTSKGLDLSNLVEVDFLL